MTEKAMWIRHVKPALARLDPVRVENPVNPGTPDVNYNLGWLELKFLREWPVRPETVVSVEHFTPQQRVWLLRRHKAGGRAFMLLQVEQDWLLFRGDVAATIVGHATRKQLIDASRGYWPNKLNPQELRECLTEPTQNY